MIVWEGEIILKNTPSIVINEWKAHYPFTILNYTLIGTADIKRNIIVDSVVNIVYNIIVINN